MSTIEKDIIEGLETLGRKLREWRDFGSLEQLQATLRDKDGNAIAVICNAENKVHVRYFGETFDLTERL